MPRRTAVPGDRALIVAVGTLHALVPLLRLDRQGRDRPRLKPANADRLVGLLAKAVGAGVDAVQGRVDFGDQFALAVAGTKLDRALGLERSTIGDVGLEQTFFLEISQSAR